MDWDRLCRVLELLVSVHEGHVRDGLVIKVLTLCSVFNTKQYQNILLKSVSTYHVLHWLNVLLTGSLV